MIGFIFGLTLRQIVGRRSVLIPVGLSLLPLLVAIVFRLSDTGRDPEHWVAQTLFLGLVVTAVLPLTALLIGTAVLGDELEDGTAIYLLTKPIERWQILLPKLAAATLVTAGLTLTTTLVSGFVALSGQASLSPMPGFAVALIIGSLAYSTLFILFTLQTSRALITGLVYVFIWEASVTTIFSGTRYLSIRHYILGLAHWLGNLGPNTFDAQVSGPLALLLIAITTVVAGLLANHRLQEIEVRESA